MTISIKKMFAYVGSVTVAVMLGVLLVANTVSAAGLQLGRDLYLGSTGADVRSLQQFLNSSGYTIASSGVGSPGYETMTFGYLTKGALIRFQAANGLSQTGAADSATRTALANWTGAVTGTTGSTNSTALAMIETLKLRIAELQKQLEAILANENGGSNEDAPYITAVKVADGGDEGVIDVKDSITITFDKAIDPESINGDLDEGETVTGITSATNGGVSVSDTGKVTIKKIASFDMGSVDSAGTFTSKLALNSTGKILTITLTSGSDIEITSEDLGSVTQIGGIIEDKDGNAMESDEGIVDATGTFGGEGDTSSADNDENPYIKSIVVADGGDEDYIDAGDTIKITFSEEIDPESINEDLAAGDSVTGVPYSSVGGVSVSSVGRVTVKGIVAFTAGEVTKSGNFSSKLALSSSGEVLTVTLSGGSDISIQDEDFMAAAQLGGAIEDMDGDEMKADADIVDPTGTFGGNTLASGDGPSIESIEVADDDSEGYIAVGDTIRITFTQEIDPTSINDDLDSGDSVTGVSASSTGGVSITSAGKVTIKNIASFDMGSVSDPGSFDVALELNSDGDELTVALESGSDIEITTESYSAVAQIGGTVANTDGDEMESDSSIDKPTGTFGGDNGGDELAAIDSIELDNGGDADFLDEGDTITIAFTSAIDPASINADLEAGNDISGVNGSEIGAVSISSSGKVTIKGITTFTYTEVDGSDSYSATLALNDDADEITIEIASGDSVEIIDDAFDANTTQVGGYIESENGDEMEADASIDDPSGSF